MNADAFGRNRLLEEWTNPIGGLEQQSHQQQGDIRYISQNLRGFKQDLRAGWMSAWRRLPVRERPAAWCLQETHVDTEEEATNLSQMWARMWGKHNDPGHAPLSYWSTGSAKSGGVAVLLTPSSAIKAKPWRVEQWSTRAIALSLEGVVLLNVYAPNQRAEREAFFRELGGWFLPRDNTLLVGDFNCVQSPLLDRRGPQRSSRPESPALAALLEDSGLIDARLLRDHAEDDDADDTTDHFTYWEGESASRIDRFYVPPTWAEQVLWVTTRAPPQPSDHQELELHLREGRPTQQKPKQNPVIYPIRSNKPEQVITELINEMDDMAIGQAASTATWDADVAECIRCIRAVRK